MNKNFLSKEQMQKLEELGIDTSNASVQVGDIRHKGRYCDLYFEVASIANLNESGIDTNDTDLTLFEAYYRAFTLQDILDMMPGDVYLSKENEFSISCGMFNTISQESYLDAAYVMLIMRHK